MGGGGGEVDIVESGTGADDDLKVLSGVKHLGGDFVRTDNEGVDISHGGYKLGGVSIFLEGGEFMAGSFDNLLYSSDSSCGKRFLGSD